MKCSTFQGQRTPVSCFLQHNPKKLLFAPTRPLKFVQLDGFGREFNVRFMSARGSNFKLSLEGTLAKRWALIAK